MYFESSYGRIVIKSLARKQIQQISRIVQRSPTTAVLTVCVIVSVDHFKNCEQISLLEELGDISLNDLKPNNVEIPKKTCRNRISAKESEKIFN